MNNILEVINEFPDLLIEQLLKNSSNQIRFTVLHEKNKEKTDNTNFNSIDFLKIYIRILEKYKFLDSDMLGFDDSKITTIEGGDLDETLKLKKEFTESKKTIGKVKKENGGRKNFKITKK